MRGERKKNPRTVIEPGNRIIISLSPIFFNFISIFFELEDQQDDIFDSSAAFPTFALERYDYVTCALDLSDIEEI